MPTCITVQQNNKCSLKCVRLLLKLKNQNDRHRGSSVPEPINLLQLKLKAFLCLHINGTVSSFMLNLVCCKPAACWSVTLCLSVCLSRNHKHKQQHKVSHNVPILSQPTPLFKTFRQSHGQRPIMLTQILSVLFASCRGELFLQ